MIPGRRGACKLSGHPVTQEPPAMSLSRRMFLAGSAAASVVAAGRFRAPRASAIDPVKRPSDKPNLKLALAAYSYRAFLDTKKGSMTLFDFIDTAAFGPVDAVELTSYF